MEDDRFKAEMTRFMGIVIKKLDHLENRFDGLENRFDGLEKEVVKTNRKIDTITGQFNDVANLVMKNDGRLSKVEIDVAELKSNVH
jgi:chromosome segregation ATPase